MSSRFTSEDLITDRWLRLRTMYYIVNKDGKKQLFEPNWAQKELFDNLWHRNIILKCRQLGFSTATSLFLLDHCIFNKDAQVGIIAHSWGDVKKLFERVKYAYNNLPDGIKSLVYPLRDSQTELMLSNGSSLRVGLSMRGATLSMLHISEMGKICAEYPDKAKEVMTGAVEAVPLGGIVIVESTAEGNSGIFFDMCKQSQETARSKVKLTQLDYRFHFFPWHKHHEYRMDESVHISTDLEAYFDKLEKMGIVLGPTQKVWYAKKKESLGDDMMREYPSTPEESFQGSQEGLIYGPQMMIARSQDRISSVPYDRSQLVHTAWDLGYSDHTAIWFFQICGQELHFIDYYQDQGKSLQEYVEIVREKSYQYGKHLAPHDVEAHELQTGLTRREYARRLGLDFEVVPRTPDLQIGIDEVRNAFNRCWFDSERCKSGIKCLDNYRKRWVSTGYWSKEPFHDESSHGASSLMYAIQGLEYIKSSGFTTEQRKQIDAARKMRYM